jgi:hypothetical protein
MADLRFCAYNDRGCEYIAATGSDLCAVHQVEAANAAASASAAVLTAHTDLGLRDIDFRWCEVPVCHARATMESDGMHLCDEHGKYASRVARMIRERDAWRIAAVVLALVLFIYVITCFVVAADQGGAGGPTPFAH